MLAVVAVLNPKFLAIDLLLAEADVAYTGPGETLWQAGYRMRQLEVAALPVRGEDGKFQGIITRDMVAERMAAGGDPKTITVGAADPVHR